MTTHKLHTGMRGQVRAINPARGIVAIETPGGFTIIELAGDEVELGDVLAWEDATALGGETYYNVTQGQVIEVYVQNHHVPRARLRQQLLLEDG